MATLTASRSASLTMSSMLVNAFPTNRTSAPAPWGTGIVPLTPRTTVNWLPLTAVTAMPSLSTKTSNGAAAGMLAASTKSIVVLVANTASANSAVSVAL